MKVIQIKKHRWVKNVCESEIRDLDELFDSEIISRFDKTTYLVISDVQDYRLFIFDLKKITDGGHFENEFNSWVPNEGSGNAHTEAKKELRKIQRDKSISLILD